MKISKLQKNKNKLFYYYDEKSYEVSLDGVYLQMISMR